MALKEKRFNNLINSEAKLHNALAKFQPMNFIKWHITESAV
jgi:hypothetical protein